MCSTCAGAETSCRRICPLCSTTIIRWSRSNSRSRSPFVAASAIVRRFPLTVISTGPAAVSGRPAKPAAARSRSAVGPCVLDGVIRRKILGGGGFGIVRAPDAADRGYAVRAVFAELADVRRTYTTDRDHGQRRGGGNVAKHVGATRGLAGVRWCVEHVSDDEP